MMPPEINTKLCLLAFVMLLGTCASSAACAVSPCKYLEPYGQQSPSVNQLGRNNSSGIRQWGGPNNDSRRLIESRPFPFGCPRPPCRGGLVD